MVSTQTAGLLFLYAETPLHPGTGASLGVVDLPVQRERTTQYPTVQASSIKGVLRAEAGPGPTTDLLFGSATEANDFAGALAVSDAKILLFPVRSLAGVFAWLTCPAVLARLQRDLSLLGQTVSWAANLAPQKGEAWLTQNSELIIKNKTERVALEEYLFAAKKSPDVEALATWLSQSALPDSVEFGWWRAKLKKKLVLLADDDFRDFVTTATEIVARTKLNNATKTVEGSALWYQEFLPAETLFYSVVLAQSARNSSGLNAEAVLAKFRELEIDRIQLGGDETTGKGFCKLRYL